MNNVRVSIIVPVYNVEKYIERCLKSLVNQTLKDIEIIIVNDDTPDNSMNLCQEYAKKDNRIKIFNKKNEGLGLTRNYGINQASGEFIAFVDSDDFVEKNFYEKMYESAIRNNSDIVFAEYKIYTYNNEIKYTNAGKIPFNNECVKPKEVLYSMLNIKTDEYNNSNMGMSVWRAIYKKKIIEKNDIVFVSEREYISEDICFNFDILENSNLVSFAKGTYYYYCYNSVSLSHSYRKDRMEKTKNLIHKLIEKAKISNEYEKMKTGLNDLFVSYVHGIIKQEVNNKQLNFKQKKNNINKILDDIELREALNNKNKKNFKNNIFDACMRKKFIFLIFILCKIKK